MSQVSRNISNALTFDVEDYYQVSAFEKYVDRDSWGKRESRVYENTHKILSFLDKKNINATFFILGYVAERNKNLVAEIQSAGHEVACHGYSHKLVYNQTPAEFKYETEKARDILESAVNTKILGYRAASYSITQKSLWALDIIEECGFIYDSSIFPIYHDRYGIEDFDRNIKKINYKNRSYDLIEFPISAARLAGFNVPISGGGYFRLYPYIVTKYLLKYYLNKESAPFMFYLHPWELDPDQPRIGGLNAFTKFRHYNNINKCEERLEKLVSDFSFTRVDTVLKDRGLLERDV